MRAFRCGNPHDRIVGKSYSWESFCSSDLVRAMHEPYLRSSTRPRSSRGGKRFAGKNHMRSQSLLRKVGGIQRDNNSGVAQFSTGTNGASSGSGEISLPAASGTSSACERISPNLTFTPDIRNREYPLAGNLKCEEPMQNTFPTKRSPFRRVLAHCQRWAVPSLVLLGAMPVYAQTGSDPWDNAVNVLKTASAGTIATGLSLVAIVVDGLMFALGEGQSKKTLAGIVFGMGMASIESDWDSEWSRAVDVQRDRSTPAESQATRPGRCRRCCCRSSHEHASGVDLQVFAIRLSYVWTQ
jgi:type IV secretory pathway VirB2 component (pilin)